MEIKELQERVDAWIKQYGVRYFSELTNMACLMEEVGELARVMARTYGDQSFKAGEKANLADEMADVLWVLVCLANQTGVDPHRRRRGQFLQENLPRQGATPQQQQTQQGVKKRFISRSGPRMRRPAPSVFSGTPCFLCPSDGSGWSVRKKSVPLKNRICNLQKQPS